MSVWLQMIALHSVFVLHNVPAFLEAELYLAAEIYTSELRLEFKTVVYLAQWSRQTGNLPLQGSYVLD